jgi:hypothetical protein
MRWSVLLAAALIVTTGCVGMQDDGGAATGTDDAGEDPGPATTWETVTRSGTVSGAGTPAGSVSQGGGNMATWSVPEDTRILYLNLTTEGGELSMQYGPDCNTEDTVECEYQTTTEDGEAREIVEDPAAGSWEAYLFIENDAGEVDWELTATMGVVNG